MKATSAVRTLVGATDSWAALWTQLGLIPEAFEDNSFNECTRRFVDLPVGGYSVYLAGKRYPNCIVTFLGW
jgi:hypothetical protein